MFNQKRNACRELMRQQKLSVSHYTPCASNNPFSWMKITLSGRVKYHPCKLKTNLQFCRVAGSHRALLCKHLCPSYYLLERGDGEGAQALFKYIQEPWIFYGDSTKIFCKGCCADIFKLTAHSSLEYIILFLVLSHRYLVQLASCCQV